MFKEPFNELQNITKCIGLYKNGFSILEVAREFKTSTNRVREVLLFSKIPLRPRGNHGLPRKPIEVIKPKGRYDHLIFEPINPGRDYKDY